MKTLVKKIATATALVSLLACAPQVKYLNGQSTKLENSDAILQDRKVEGLNNLEVAPREVKSLNKESTRKGDYQIEFPKEQGVYGLDGREVK